MLDYALGYARRGWRVHPLAPSGKVPITKHGVKDATTDEDTIRLWWNHQIDANIGIACGEESGIVVLDIDPRNGGDRSWRRLVDKYDIPQTRVVDTGGGGFHYYFAYPEVPAKKRVVASGLDLVSDGGYVVAPPSVHPSGQPYRWRHRTVPLADFPEWLREEQEGTTNGFSIPSRDELREIVSGERNNRLTQIAGSMRRWGLSPSAIYSALHLHNQEACIPPLPNKEVRRIAGSIGRYRPEHGKKEQKEGSSVSIAGRPVADGRDGPGAQEHSGSGDDTGEHGGRGGSGRSRAPKDGPAPVPVQEGQAPEPVAGVEGGEGDWWS